jgi:hypothetical protein
VTDAVLAAVGESWRLGEQLAGGLQGGAWRVHDGDVTAVLKVHDPASDVPRNPDCATVVEHLRASGYPTPAWLASGVTDAGFGWSIQELAVGEHVMRFDAPSAARVIALAELQRSITPPTAYSWSDFVLAKTGLEMELPDDETVHCDFNVANILVLDGRVSAVVDIDAAGRGCAAYDVVAMRASVLPWNPEPGAIAMLDEWLRDTYDAEVVDVIRRCVAIEREEWLAKRATGPG